MGGPTERAAARVVRFGDASAIGIARQRVRPPRGNEVLVRVTHAALGATDVLARRGGYVLQPVPGFVPGYDFVGVLETESAVSVALGLRTGARVAGVLPRMGAHATLLVLPPTYLVAVPDALSSEAAATVPLNGVTAALALRYAGPAPRILIQGITGAVGALAAQLALRDGRTLFGTGTTPPPGLADGDPRLTLVDYRDPGWPAEVRERTGGGVEAAIDHTGSPLVREAVAPDGVVVRTAFAGRSGHERGDALRGTAAAVVRSRAHPREVVCSVPFWVLRKRVEYRRMLAGLLGDVAEGRLRAFEPEVYPFSAVWDAHRAAEARSAGRTVVLAM
ncbi:quinone oxidoreductase family protein [Leifsonia shinshuensis]|uniref:NADPH:quinone reductase-like Zn-dependent oxidoreductase n=1 Tax=Leifsonia shinshuensis TaxID=150026 RepID=A0A853CYH1_9MICO|nr:zinc-binding dehydrogenase [Leifsonia shinshuensis]NYJ25588.1 NADPH:quinone reductase-like Zn-dependent oxidoreductase [Leifsonia shinshuensis]